MGRLELAGIDPCRTPPARFWRALWALFVEYHATFGAEADAAVRKMWGELSSAVGQPGQLTQGTSPSSERAPTAVAPPRFTNVETDPETGQPRRPTAAEREAWAKAYSSTGPLVADASRSAGAAPQVGRPERG